MLCSRFATPTGNGNIEGGREVSPALESAFSDEGQRPPGFANVCIGRRTQKGTQVYFVLRPVVVAGEDLEGDQVRHSGYGHVDFRESLDKVSCSNDLWFDSRRRKKQVYDHSFCGLAGRQEARSSQTADRFLLDCCKHAKAGAHQAAYDVLRRAVVVGKHREIDVAGKAGFGAHRDRKASHQGAADLQAVEPRNDIQEGCFEAVH